MHRMPYAVCRKCGMLYDVVCAVCVYATYAILRYAVLFAVMPYVSCRCRAVSKRYAVCGMWDAAYITVYYHQSASSTNKTVKTDQA
jgi:hypothetical protein